MTTITAPPPARSGHVGLRRDIGLVGMIWASEGSIIGSGWLFGALLAAQAAGTAAIVSWLIGAAAIIVLAFVHAELGAAYPVAGGTGRFPHYAFGTIAGASFGWFSWLQAVTVAPIEVMATLNYAAAHLPWVQHAKNQLTPAGYAIAGGLMALFVAVNFLGIRLLSHTNSAATWWKVAVPLFTILVLAVTHFHGGNFGFGGFAPFGIKGVLSAVSTSGIVFALLGFEQADQLAGESRNPGRDIPRAIIGAILLGAAIYLLLQIVFIGALPHSAFAQGWGNLTFTGKAGPFAGLATTIGLGWLAALLYIDAIISPSGTGLIYTTAGSRVSYGLSRNGYVPEIFEHTNRRGVPWFGLLFTFLVGLLVFLPFPTWQKLVGFVTSASVLMYAGAPLALGVLRRNDPNRTRPFRLPGAGFWSPVAFIVANLIIYWSGFDTLWRLGVAIVLGYLLIGASVWFKLNPRTPRLDFRAAQWLPVYLIGMGVISWQGGFCSTGPASSSTCGATSRIGLWWDILIIAAFSLVIYFWAQAVRLPPAKTQAYIGDLPVGSSLGPTGDGASSDHAAPAR
jgi:amino acid transporter